MSGLTPDNRLETFLAEGSSATIEPYTRLERILAGQDIEPYNRLEHFAKQAASGGGGGSSLPPYTSADNGKVLTVGEGSESETVVIVPEQSVTITTELPYSVLTGADDSALQNILVGSTATAVINGTTYQAIGISQNGMTAYAVNELNAIFTYSSQFGGSLFGIEGETAGGTYTVSLTAEIPKAELKWEPDDDTLLITVDGGSSSTTYAQAKEALINGKNVKIVFINNGVVSETGVATTFNYNDSSNFPYEIYYYSHNVGHIDASSENGSLGTR